MLCPAGRYSIVSYMLNPLCSAACSAGFYCPAGSVSNGDYLCGSAAVYCPEGSGAPITVMPGYYSLGGVDDTTRSAQALCGVGNFCTEGLSRACPLGYYGNTTGLYSPFCSGSCPAGYYCLGGTVNPTPCGGDTVFCPGGSASSTSVAAGYYATGGSGANASYYRTGQRYGSDVRAGDCHRVTRLTYCSVNCRLP
jgi:hypothetical protein